MSKLRSLHLRPIGEEFLATFFIVSFLVTTSWYVYFAESFFTRAEAIGNFSKNSLFFLHPPGIAPFNLYNKK